MTNLRAKERIESTVMPTSPFEIKFDGNVAEVTFFDDIREEVKTDSEGKTEQKMFSWNEYTLHLKNREGLVESIENQTADWIAFAKQISYDETAKFIREKRDELLKESDATMCLDRIDVKVPKTDKMTDWIAFMKKIAERMSGDWASYRQELRDIPQQKGFPYDVNFPEKPNIK